MAEPINRGNRQMYKLIIKRRRKYRRTDKVMWRGIKGRFRMFKYIEQEEWQVNYGLEE